MKRRQFFKNAAFASAGLGLAAPGVRAKKATKTTACSNATFIGQKKISSEGDVLSAEVWFCPGPAQNLREAAEEDKVLQARFVVTGAGRQYVYHGKYLMKSSVPPADGSDKRTIEATIQLVVIKDFIHQEDLDFDKLTFLFDFTRPDRKLAILDRNGQFFMELIEADDFENCFLTTACVNHRGLPDDCPELEMMRRFRDEVLMRSEEGVRLVKEYYEIAPPIVKAISASPLKDSVFGQIYTEMILPTLGFINSGNHEAAITHYKDYTLMLRDSFSEGG